MSSYIVDDKTISRILIMLQQGTLSGKLHNSRFPSPEYISELITASSDKALLELGNDLLEMNTDAVNQRYTDTQTSGPFVFHTPGLTCAPQALKSLQCFLYQCSEGNIPEYPLYKALRKYENSLALHIVSKLPEYNKAEWA